MIEPKQVGTARTPAPRQSLTEAARAARGLHPLELLAQAESDFAPETRHFTPPSYSPEPHILDSEWYFTSASSALLGSMVSEYRPCLLGTPTVAPHIPLSDYVLVDRSPYIRERFPSIVESNLRSVDVQGWVVEPGRGAVLLDPPWYFPEFRSWLSVALLAVELGGLVLLPLLGEQTRPTAAQERDQVLQFLASTGSVEVLRDVLEYDMPLFESRALAAAGVTLSAPWRRADLAVARVSRRPRDSRGLPGSRAAGSRRETGWTTYLIGSQVVKLRSPLVGRSVLRDRLLETVPEVEGFTLDSVSRRDPRIEQVDVWSSRNRVARVLNVDLLTHALRILETSTLPVPRLGDELLRQGLSRREIHELFDYLEMTDGD